MLRYSTSWDGATRKLGNIAHPILYFLTITSILPALIAGPTQISNSAGHLI
jgi:hypothetical protein